MRTKYILLHGERNINVGDYSKQRGMPVEDTFTDVLRGYDYKKDFGNLSESVWDRLEIHDLDSGSFKSFTQA